MEVLPLAEQMKKGHYPVLDIGYCEKISLRGHYIDCYRQCAFPNETRVRWNSLFNERSNIRISRDTSGEGTTVRSPSYE